VTAPLLVLVVDDEPDVRAFICEILEGAGYRTRGLDSGASALQRAPLDRPALILLDIYLADLDGYTVASRIRELPATAHTPIIFITGADAPVHRTLAFGLGAVYLRKPITAAHLLQTVSQALPRRERGGEAAGGRGGGGGRT
jgi:CheY-like chemotaxis protein